MQIVFGLRLRSQYHLKFIGGEACIEIRTSKMEARDSKN